MRAIAAERELQDAHAGETAVVAQRDHVGSDETQVFRDDWQRSQCAPDRRKQFSTRRLHPSAQLRSRAARRNFPVRREAAEMIYA